jgi:hypothetical protein
VLGTVLCTVQRPMQPRDGHVQSEPGMARFKFPPCLPETQTPVGLEALQSKVDSRRF